MVSSFLKENVFWIARVTIVTWSFLSFGRTEMISSSVEMPILSKMTRSSIMGCCLTNRRTSSASPCTESRAKRKSSISTRLSTIFFDTLIVSSFSVLLVLLIRATISFFNFDLAPQ
uniref:(northern house mosquito) hypothetical protein n=1 Tax=Culex pipiens TaxID=7175 RepID=A0A8D8AQN9_CULPI